VPRLRRRVTVWSGSDDEIRHRGGTDPTADACDGRLQDGGLDTDFDGLLDIWETESGLKDPQDHALPDLSTMASPGTKDLFVQIDYMSNGEDTYGGVPKPAHNHLPDPTALKMVGDAFAPRDPRPFRCWKQLSGRSRSCVIPYSSDPTTNLARGGKAIDENVTLLGCPGPTCEFPDYPGTIGWKVGFKFYRDQLLSATPPSLDEAGNDPCDVPSATPGDSNYDGPGGRASVGSIGTGWTCSATFWALMPGSRKSVPLSGRPGVPGARRRGSLQFPPLPHSQNELRSRRLSWRRRDADARQPRCRRTARQDPMQGSTLMRVRHTFDLGHSGVYVPGAPAEPAANRTT
jgi:hypothetical protein